LISFLCFTHDDRYVVCVFLFAFFGAIPCPSRRYVFPFLAPCFASLCPSHSLYAHTLLLIPGTLPQPLSTCFSMHPNMGYFSHHDQEPFKLYDPHFLELTFILEFLRKERAIRFSLFLCHTTLLCPYLLGQFSMSFPFFCVVLG